MLQTSLSFATIDDTNLIMQFMHNHWRENHILSQSKALLFHEFKEGKQLNLAVAKNVNGELLGLFGFMKYNSNSMPDIAGSLWKVRDDAQKQNPMLGLQLRNFVIRSVPHRFFAAPGAGLQTRPIYHVIRMNWHRMDQFFLVNEKIQTFTLLQISENFERRIVDSNIDNDISLIKVNSADELSEFDFDKYSHIVPYKDHDYVKKRFFDYLYNQYDVYIAKQASEIKNIVVCRRVEINGATVLRIVDFYGEEDNIAKIIQSLYQVVLSYGDEYLDFVCHGFDRNKLNAAGMMSVEFEKEDVIVPNFFEPLVLKNIPVYCVSDQTNLTYRQCKADGDQDRPNHKC